MGKYLLVAAVLGASVYLYADLQTELQGATQYEVVQLHNPLIPLPVSETTQSVNTQNEARILLTSYPAKGS